MPRIYIYGNAGLWHRYDAMLGLYHLEEDLNDFLQDAGRVTWDEHKGRGWNVDLLLYEDADIDDWVQRLIAFLREWGVPDDAFTITIHPESSGETVRRVEVPAGQ